MNYRAMYLSDLQRERVCLVKEGNVEEVALINAELVRRARERECVNCSIGKAGNMRTVSGYCYAIDAQCLEVKVPLSR